MRLCKDPLRYGRRLYLNYTEGNLPMYMNFEGITLTTDINDYPF